MVVLGKKNRSTRRLHDGIFGLTDKPCNADATVMLQSSLVANIRNNETSEICCN